MEIPAFVRNVATLASGTLLAQLLPLLASPLLTRLYTPAQFGLFALFMAIFSTLHQATTGHYEIAMITPKRNQTARELFVIALYYALGFSLLVLASLLLMHTPLLKLIDAQQLGNWIYLLPLMLFLAGSSQLINHYANRAGKYTYMAQATLIQGISIVFISLLLGLLQAGFMGLIAGYAGGYTLSFLFLAWRYHRDIGQADFSWSQRKSRIAQHFRDYPIFSGSMSIFDGLSLALPTFFIAAGYPEAIVGYYALVMRTLYTPLTFLSTSVGQVNLKKIVQLIHDKQALTPYLGRITLVLILIASMPASLLFLFGPELFAFVFGTDWRIAGEFAQILAPALIIRFTASTLSNTLTATRNPRLAGLWKIISFVSTLSILWFFTGEVSASKLLKYLMIKDILLYFFYYTLIYFSARQTQKEQ